MEAKPFPGLTLARILRPWGRRGDVAAEILTDRPERLLALRNVWLRAGLNPARPASVHSCRIHLGQAIFHFQGVETISEAEGLRGLEVQVPLEERAPLASGRYYITDLVGCTVWDQDSEACIGTVRDVQNTAAAAANGTPPSWLLVVETAAPPTTPLSRALPRAPSKAEDALLIPLAANICTRIDTTARRIEVRLPQGLREVNVLRNGLRKLDQLPSKLV